MKINCARNTVSENVGRVIRQREEEGEQHEEEEGKNEDCIRKIALEAIHKSFDSPSLSCFKILGANVHVSAPDIIEGSILRSARLVLLHRLLRLSCLILTLHDSIYFGSR